MPDSFHFDICCPQQAILQSLLSSPTRKREIDTAITVGFVIVARL